MNRDDNRESDDRLDIEGAETCDVVLDPITDAIIRSSIKIGIPELTRSNAEEFHTRIKCLERSGGYYALADPVDGAARNPTLQEILDRIGIRAKADLISRGEFLAGLPSDVWSLADRDTKRELLRIVQSQLSALDHRAQAKEGSPPAVVSSDQPSVPMPEHMARAVEAATKLQHEGRGDPAHSPAYVGGGVMLQPREDAMDTLVHQQANRARAVSLAISLAISGLLIAVLAWWGITVFRADEIEIVVAASQVKSEATVEKKQFQQSVRQRPSRPSSSPNNTITAARASPISVPTIETDLNSPNFGTSFGTGFGGGGFGDGFGGGMGVPGAMRGRCNASDRASRLAKAGGKPSTERAVLDALRWLKGQQNEDGSFGARYPVAMTGLVLLAYSGHCETVDSPEFGQTVKKCIEYLVGVTEKTKGMLSSSGKGDKHASYEHGIAVYALSEAYSINRNARKPFKRISPALKKAVPIVIEGQTSIGGWLYGYGQGANGDLSISGWNIQALKAAELTGLKFSGLKEAKKKAINYLEAAEDPNGAAGCYTYTIGGGGKLSLTGVGALCARMMGAPSKLEEKCLDLIVAAEPTTFAGANVYAWYYHSQAAFQAQGKHWKAYNKSYQSVVLEAQEKDGSWPIAGGHATNDAEGKVYTTALCTLMLEVYYRYLPATK